MAKWKIRPPFPKTPEAIVTKLCMGNYIGDIPMQNFMTTFQICENARQVSQVTRLLFLPLAYSQDTCTDFYDQYVI